MIDMIVPIIKIAFLIYLIYQLGFIYGFASYFFSYYASIFLIEKVNGLEQINSPDAMFYVEYKYSPNVIHTAVVMEKTDFASFKKVIKERGAGNFRRLRQKVVKILNEYFWKEISQDEAVDSCVKQFTSDVRSVNALMNFIETEFPRHMNFDKPLWEIFFKENYSETESMFVLKFHHSLGDGLSLLSLISGISDNFNSNELNSKAMSIPFWRKALLFFASPYYMSVVMPKFNKEDQNPLIRFAGKLSGEKKLSMTKQFDFNRLRSIYKKYDGATFNDLAWNVLSRAISKYSTAALNETSKVVIGAMAISFRSEFVPYELGNSSAGLMVRVSVKDDFSEGMKDIKETLEPIKDKSKLYSATFMLNFMAKHMMNETLMRKAGEKSFEQVAFIFTNVPGPEAPISIGGKKLLEIYPFVPHGNLSFSVVIFSYGGKIRFALHADAINGPDVTQITKLIEEEIDQQLTRS